MKNNLDFYSHAVTSHNSWKFKLLRKQFGWAGEGKFWALNNLIADSDMCVLDLEGDSKKEQIAADLDFDIDEFRNFLMFLEIKCKLIKKESNGYTTKRVQKALQVVNRAREIDRKRKNGIHAEK